MLTTEQESMATSYSFRELPINNSFVILTGDTDDLWDRNPCGRKGLRIYPQTGVILLRPTPSFILRVRSYALSSRLHGPPASSVIHDAIFHNTRDSYCARGSVSKTGEAFVPESQTQMGEHNIWVVLDGFVGYRICSSVPRLDECSWIRCRRNWVYVAEEPCANENCGRTFHCSCFRVLHLILL